MKLTNQDQEVKDENKRKRSVGDKNNHMVSHNHQMKVKMMTLNFKIMRGKDTEM